MITFGLRCHYNEIAMKRLDLVGQRFGRLVVVSFAGKVGTERCNRWNCKCDCGKSTTVRATLLICGKTKSCGCLLKDATKAANFKDITCQRFGKLTAIKVAFKKKGSYWWECACDCGGTKISAVNYLISGDTKSCGCLQRIAARLNIEIARKQINNKTHGETVHYKQSAEYQIWSGMLNRCYNQRNSHFKYYGARGIGVCDRWRFGENNRSGINCFIDDLGRRPSKNHSVERLNVNMGYGPENCIWATPDVQAKNKTDNVFVVIDGRKMIIADAIRSGAVTIGRYHYWRNKGMTAQEIVNKFS